MERYDSYKDSGVKWLGEIHFYKPAPLRSLEENERDIRELDEQSQGFILSLFDLV